MNERHTETHIGGAGGQSGGNAGTRQETVRHIWLYQPGEWAARGHHWVGGTRQCPVRGRSVVRHGPDAWEIDSEMQPLGETPQRFRNVCRLRPPQAGARVRPWRSDNPDTGPLVGSSFMTERSVLSLFQSEDASLRGGGAGPARRLNTRAERVAWQRDIGGPRDGPIPVEASAH